MYSKLEDVVCGYCSHVYPCVGFSASNCSWISCMHRKNVTEEPVTISSAVELAHWEPRTQVFNCGVFLTVTYWSNLVIPFPFVTSKKKTVNNHRRLNSPDITAQLSSYFYLGRLWNLNTLNRSLRGTGLVHVHWKKREVLPHFTTTFQWRVMRLPVTSAQMARLLRL